MPNAGIHACRSTNWKSADAGSKRLQSSSVAANDESETTSASVADQRLALVLVAALADEQQRAARRRAAATMSDSRIGKGITRSNEVTIERQVHRHR